jgi:hypothetical protein
MPDPQHCRVYFKLYLLIYFTNAEISIKIAHFVTRTTRSIIMYIFYQVWFYKAKTKHWGTGTGMRFDINTSYTL